jgi:hypothetical protein
MNTTYIDYLMKNYPIEKQSAGKHSKHSKYNKPYELEPDIESKNIPNGGFPPIYECTKNKSYDAIIKEEDTIKKREYTSHQTAVKIQDILEKRRNVVPFITI